MNATLAAFVPAIGWALIDFLWQGLLIGALAALALRLLREARPQSRYLVCAIALAACVVLPVLQVARGLHADANAVPMVADAAHSAPLATSAVFVAVDETWQDALQQHLPWVVVLWSLGAALFALRMSLGLIWVHQLGRTRARSIDHDWQHRLDDLADALDVYRDVRLRILDATCALSSPVAVGIFRPVVLVPAALLARMQPELLEALLAHELAHIRRRDYLVNLIQSAVEALLFYHPVVWWLSRRMREEREQIADDLAARAIGQPRRLALALDALDRCQCESIALSQPLPAANGGHLMSRIQRLIQRTPDPSRRHTTSWWMALPILIFAAVCLTVYAHGRSAATPAAVTPRVNATPVPAEPVVVQPSHDRDVTVEADAMHEANDADASDDVSDNDADKDGKDSDASDDMDYSNSAPGPDSDSDSDTPVLAADTLANAHGAHPATASASDHRRDAYALVRAGKDGMTMSGDSGDDARVEHLRQNVRGDFLWTRHDGKEYIVQDPEIIAGVVQAWSATEALGKQMDALGKQMDVPGKRMEELGRQMQALEMDRHPEGKAMEESGEQMGALGREQGAIAVEMAGLELQMQGADRAQRDRLRAKLEAERARMEPLKERMKQLAAEMARRGQEMEKQREPMEALAKQMEAEREPMEAVGRQMRLLGRQMEERSHEADRAAREQLDRAIREGKAAPVHEQAP
jgi:beta-lactamase regulating signal transducer with metallopeptidase domain